MESILTSIKKLLGPSAEYTHFDPDIIMHINDVFVTLIQLGVGPSTGFSIEDDTSVWTDFLSDTHWFFPSLKTYVYKKVKLAFDPPLGSAVLDSLKEQIRETEWRLNTAVETISKEENQNE